MNHIFYCSLMLATLFVGCSLTASIILIKPVINNFKKRLPFIESAYETYTVPIRGIVKRFIIIIILAVILSALITYWVLVG